MGYAASVGLRLIAIYVGVYISFIDFSELDETIHFSTAEVLRHNGYEAEEYDVETEDGFVTRIERIVSKHPRPNNSVVLIPSSFSVSTKAFVFYSPKDLVYRISDEGYDVWLANVRGTAHWRPKEGTNHTEEEITESSFHEQGYYDIPAIIDFILNKTSQTRLQIIAHSAAYVATTIALTTRTEYNNNVSQILHIGPYTTFSTFCKVPVVLSQWFKWLRHSLALMTPEITYVACANPLSFLPCNWYFNTFYGMDNKDVNLVVRTADYYLKGDSIGLAWHLMQWVDHKGMPDYGRTENLKRYNSETPPLYNLSEIRVPITMYYSNEDVFTDAKGLAELQQNVPTIKEVKLAPGNLHHIQFIYNNSMHMDYIQDVIRTLGKGY